jgi:hypothetical protein
MELVIGYSLVPEPPASIIPFIVYLVCLRVLGTGSWFLGSVSGFLVPGSWFLVPGSWFLVPICVIAKIAIQVKYENRLQASGVRLQASG